MRTASFSCRLGGVCPGGCTPPLLPWTEWLTDRCKTLPCPKLRLRAVISVSKSFFVWNFGWISFKRNQISGDRYIKFILLLFTKKSLIKAINQTKTIQVNYLCMEQWFAICTLKIIYEWKIDSHIFAKFLLYNLNDGPFSFFNPRHFIFPHSRTYPTLHYLMLL